MMLIDNIDYTLLMFINTLVNIYNKVFMCKDNIHIHFYNENILYLNISLFN